MTVVGIGLLVVAGLMGCLWFCQVLDDPTWEGFESREDGNTDAASNDIYTNGGR